MERESKRKKETENKREGGKGGTEEAMQTEVFQISEIMREV